MLVLLLPRSPVTLLLTLALLGSAEPTGAATAGRRTRNFPAISDTPEGGWIITEEFNVDGRQGLTNTTVDYGLFKVWDAGISLLNGTVYHTKDATSWNPDVLANVERFIEVDDNVNVILGTAIGSRPWDTSPQRLEVFTYLDSRFDLPKQWGSVHGGAYYANAALAGTHAVAGYLVGVQIPLSGEQLQFNGDFISGNNNLSMASAVLLMKVTRHLQYGLGFQIAAPTADAETTAQFGLYWTDLPDLQQPVGH